MSVVYSVRWLRGVVVRLQGALVRLQHRGRFDNGLRVFGLPVISFARGSTTAFGQGLVLVSDSHFSEPGVSHPVVLRTLTPKAVLAVGNNVGMSGCAVCAAESVTIGNDCLLGADVIVADTDFHPIKPDGRRWRRDGVLTAPIVIGDNVFLGARSIVLKGVTIGDNAVVGAGSVVVNDVPVNAVAAGTPARVVGWVTSEGPEHVEW